MILSICLAIFLGHGKKNARIKYMGDNWLEYDLEKKKFLHNRFGENGK